LSLRPFLPSFAHWLAHSSTFTPLFCHFLVVYQFITSISFSRASFANMPESAVETLRATVEKLQQQVEQLEQRLAGSAGGSNTQDGMRMILIGPPGAGTSYVLRRA
jgi:tRNA U34 5-carboxymethylaminomethyl modifying GTPase MnmE/TrmE